jgi:spore photoproduct lyase
VSSPSIAASFSQLFVERGEEDTPIARRVVQALPHLEPQPIDDAAEAEPPAGADRFGSGKRRLVLTRRRGGFLEHCPAGTSGLVCCNYLVITLGSNCPMDCRYCFLQAYLQNNPALKVYTNPEDALAEVDQVLRRHPEREFRIGTGELVDSLALDPLTQATREMVPFFAARPNGVLELKTKTASIDNLLDLDAAGRTVVSWSLSPAPIVAGEEPGTASLDERLAAAVRLQRAGFKVGFHFDPLVEYPGWETGYADVVARLAAALDPRGIAWISLGSLRLTPQLKAAVRGRGPTRLLSGELVPGLDGKLRLWHGLRVKMYRSIAGALRAWSEAFPLYLCMEDGAVWRQVFAEVPGDRELGRRLAAGATW